ncbi:MAG: hypothetical protein II719_04510 [Clostridia bacterium]|nr:hypothetical protein [Clostridia bacterium]
MKKNRCLFLTVSLLLAGFTALVSCGNLSGTEKANEPEQPSDGIVTETGAEEFTVPGSLLPEERAPVLTPRIVETLYPTDEVVLSMVDVLNDPYHLDRTGEQDATEGINRALQDVFEAGGGTVFLPAGSYRVTGQIVIPPYCTLHGDWQDPDVGQEYGTVILADVETAETQQNALFLLGGSGGVNGLTVFYPDQDLKKIKKYPATFYVNGQGDNYMLSSVINCTVLNGYLGVGACIEENNAHEELTVENLKGTFLYACAEVYNQADVGTWSSVRVSPKYWAECSLTNEAPSLEDVRYYTRAHAAGLILGDLEWTEFSDLEVSECRYGIQIVKGHRIEFAGSFYDIRVSECDIALKADAMDSRWGLTVVNSSLWGSVCSVENNTSGIIKMVNVTLTGETGGTGQIENDEKDISKYLAKRNESYQKPVGLLYVFNGSSDGKRNVSGDLQTLLDRAGETGGVVYLPSGYYRLDAPVSVPAGVELRGCAGGPTRDQRNATKGTVLLSYYGDGPAYDEKSAALITLKEYAGVNGIRIVFPENGPKDDSLSTVYAIRGVGTGVYTVNCSIAAAAYGVDFSGCDGHFIKKLQTGVYYNAIRVGGAGGYVEGCLQNGTVLCRCGNGILSFTKHWIEEGSSFEDYFPITRSELIYLKVQDGDGEVVYNTFAYGPNMFLEHTDATDTLCVNIGADNLGSKGPQIKMNSGSATVLGMLRYNGRSYVHRKGTLRLYARLTINDKSERTYVMGKNPE